MFSDPGGRPRGLPVFLVGMLGFELLLIVGYRRLMEKIIDMGLSPEAHYRILDEGLTVILNAAEVDVDEEILTHLLAYNRHLRIALGLPVEVAS